MKITCKALLLLMLGAGNCAYCNALTGNWRGELSIGPNKLPLVFNFNEDNAGKTEATMDSPQQNAKDIPFEVLYCANDSLSLDCKKIGASFNGRILEGAIEGTFVQRGYSFPLTLKPEDDLKTRRPQTPQPPFPYTETDTVFYSTDGTRMAGTLTVPRDYSKTYPTVVFVTGSGPQNRDEEVFGHRPFAVIADFLARNGIASFRYDDRGTGQSLGDYKTATINTFKEDLENAVSFVSSLPQAGKTGILGHSEGGTLAVLAAESVRPDFIISLAGMVIPAKKTLLEQNSRSLDQMGITGKDKDDTLALIGILFDEIRNQYEDGTAMPIDIDKICKDNSLSVHPGVIASMKNIESSRSPYFNSIVSLDPTDSLKKISCPVLAINGTKDVQVNASENLGAFESNVPTAEIRRMEGLNHLLQNAVSGDVSEYGSIQETISPEVLSIIKNFIRNLN